MTEITNYERANKVSVKTVGEVFQADFYRTHKHIASLKSNETGWQVNADMNKSAQREDFRQFAIDHAADIQVNYDPEDRRTPRNTRIATYVDDGMVQVDAANMLHNDIRLLLDDSNPYDLTMGDIIMESITAKTTTSKGTSLDALGITDGKYLNGNWAWANIDMLVTFTIPTAGGQTFQMLYPMELVSGQLKKFRLTKTAFNEGIKAELISMGLVEPDQPKEEKKSKGKAEKSAEPEVVAESETPTEEIPTTEKPKRQRKSKKTTEQVEG